MALRWRAGVDGLNASGLNSSTTAAAMVSSLRTATIVSGGGVRALARDLYAVTWPSAFASSGVSSPSATTVGTVRVRLEPALRTMAFGDFFDEQVVIEAGVQPAAVVGVSTE